MFLSEAWLARKHCPKSRPSSSAPPRAALVISVNWSPRRCGPARWVEAVALGLPRRMKATPKSSISASSRSCRVPWRKAELSTLSLCLEYFWSCSRALVRLRSGAYSGGSPASKSRFESTGVAPKCRFPAAKARCESTPKAPGLAVTGDWPDTADQFNEMGPPSVPFSWEKALGSATERKLPGKSCLRSEDWAKQVPTKSAASLGRRRCMARIIFILVHWAIT